MSEGKDFFEGVRCLLVDRKDKPKWSHNSMLEVSNSEICSFFEKLSEDFELKL